MLFDLPDLECLKKQVAMNFIATILKIVKK